MNAELRQQIYTVVSRIPPGRVTSYGRIAGMTEGATARMVGAAMGHLPDGHGLPWHRVINASGRIADHGGAQRQRLLLREEGIDIDNRARVPARYFWP